MILAVLVACCWPLSATTIPVPGNGDLQAALNQAQPGDTIVLEGGATYTGSFTLPNKNGNADITIETSALSALPPAGVRIDPSYAQYMPKLVSPTVAPSLAAYSGAHNYRFIGIEFSPSLGKWQYDVVAVGSGQEKTVAALPHDIDFDRVWVHGDPAGGTKRGIAMNGMNVTVENSYISDIMEQGQDTQALCGWNTPGPLTITNNFLEASGENVMIGGAKAFIPNVIPSNVLIQHNYFYKPLSWRVGDPSYAGKPWTVKNLLEFKNAQQVLVDGNIFEHSWACAQDGTAILFTPRTINGTNEWAEDQDITLTHNIIEHVPGGFSFEGVDNTDPQKNVMRVHRITIQNNMLLDVNGHKWSHGEDWLLLVTQGSDHLTFDHNTGISHWFFAQAAGELAVSNNFVFTNNLCNEGQYGFFGSDVGTGIPALNKYFPGWAFANNIILNGDPKIYPIDNFFPKSNGGSGIANPTGVQVSPSSPYYEAGSEGLPVGADVDAVLAATANVIPGVDSATLLTGM